MQHTPVDNETSRRSASLLAVATAEFDGGERRAQKGGGGQFRLLEADDLFSSFRQSVCMSAAGSWSGPGAPPQQLKFFSAYSTTNSFPPLKNSCMHQRIFQQVPGHSTILNGSVTNVWVFITIPKRPLFPSRSLTFLVICSNWLLVPTTLPVTFRAGCRWRATYDMIPTF